MLDPLALDSGWSGRCAPTGDHPRSREVALLAQVGTQHSDLEVLRLDPAEPPLEHPKRRVDRDCLMVVGWRPRPNRPGIGAVLPEERPHAAPVPQRKASGVPAEEMLNGVLVPAGTRGGTIFDPAPRHSEEADAESRQAPAGQADRRFASSCARSSSFSLRVLGVSSAKAQTTMPSGSMSTYARLEKNFSSIRVP